MSFQPIDNEEIAQGSVVGFNLLSKIKSNFDFQEVKLAEKEAAIAAQSQTLSTQANLINKTVPLGTVRHSVLSLAQFQAESHGVWMLMNGQSCTGTAYQTLTGNANVPDARGTFLRAKDHGRGVNPSGDLAVGTYQDMDWKGFYQHNTAQNTTTNYSHGPVYMGKSTAGYVGNLFVGRWATPAAAMGTMWDTSEIRPKNLTVNMFIKVGY